MLQLTAVPLPHVAHSVHDHFISLMTRSRPQAKRLLNFCEDFADGLVLYSVLTGHWPAFSLKRASLHTGPVITPHDCHDNAELVIRMMRVRGVMMFLPCMGSM